MDFEKAIDQVASTYIGRGYSVIARPTPDDLPPFAKDFKVQLVCRMKDIGVLVAIKRNRDEFAADPEMDRYAEIASSQPGWRFDFVLLEGSGLNREIRGAQELSDAHFAERIAVIEQLTQEPGLLLYAFVSAWALCEASMRRALNATGQIAGWGTQPRQMMNELVSSGLISTEDHSRLLDASRLRNEIVHGFAVRPIDISDVKFVLDLTLRLNELAKGLNPS